MTSRIPQHDVDLVRAARIQISKEFGDDPKRLIAHYFELQKRFADRLIHGPDGEPDSRRR
jgi:hypothetical protein